MINKQYEHVNRNRIQKYDFFYCSKTKQYVHCFAFVKTLNDKQSEEIA